MCEAPVFDRDEDLDFEYQQGASQDAQEPASADRPLSGPELAAIDYQPPAYVLQCFILEKLVNLLYGDGGTGKSMLALHIAVAVERDLRLWGLSTKRMPVLIISAEDDAGELKQRQLAICEALGTSLRELTSLYTWPRVGLDSTLAIIKDDGTWTEGPFLAALRAQLKAIGPCLLILDTVSDIAVLDEKLRPPVNTLCKRVLASLCKDYGATVLVLAHPSKAAMVDGSDYAGGTAWNNAVRNRLVFKRMDEDPRAPGRRLRVAKTNYGAEVELDLVLDGRVLSVPGGSGKAERENAERRAVFDVVAMFRDKGIRVVRHNGDGMNPGAVAKTVKDRAGLNLTKARVVDILRQCEIDGTLIYAESEPGKKGHRATYELGTGGRE
jgi:hypothetical protein